MEINQNFIDALKPEELLEELKITQKRKAIADFMRDRKGVKSELKNLLKIEKRIRELGL